ncbi:CaiB/BaiF CoA-transferase family protein [Alicyclobacillus sp. SO9]|uniref:CaiB/BaiF CoA transferase family protein n=1 Tax=Alicyclobacillus sp. SO9 TaxID=2665646 RepID=UPI0018E874DB|nr:CoA transferase [Alicyclobacillus sp. SO9]QQE80014.1 CoA transferase [Alicyclobacillus sp. SO9]
MGALTGIRVLEVGTLLAGPFTGRLLGDFGAEVIKIEPPDRSDPMRHWGQQIDGEGLLWPVQSRNKKCITLNLRKPEGQRVFKELAAEADVVLENFRPGTMEKWGLGYEELKTVNPGIIMLRTSGFGQTGPYSSQAGFGSVGEAMGGLRYVTGYGDRPPTRVGISIGDSLAALFATIGCLLALQERNKSGQGQVVDTAIYEAVFSLMEGLVPEYALKGYVRERSGNILPGVAPANIYETKESDYVVIGANADTVFKRLAQAMGAPEMAEDERYATHNARGQNQDELDNLINEWTQSVSTDDLLQILSEFGVPAGKIYSAKDIVNDPHYLARDMILSMMHPHLGEFKLPGIVPKLSRTPGEVNWLGPAEMGEHNSEVYQGQLGYTDGQINQLKRLEII